MADDRQDIREQLENAITVLASTPPGDPHAASRNLGIALETLRAARTAVAELDAELELVTSPERDAATEAQDLRQELQTARDRATDLELELAMAREEHEVEEQVHAVDRDRLKDLEKKVKGLDDILMNDEDAFDKFMDQALDRDERLGRGPSGQA